MKQLDLNLAALDLPLLADHIERLDKLSEPTLNFPALVMKIAPNFSNAGATVNGIESTLLPFAPKDLEDHYSLRSIVASQCQANIDLHIGSRAEPSRFLP